MKQVDVVRKPPLSKYLHFNQVESEPLTSWCNWLHASNKNINQSN